MATASEREFEKIGGLNFHGKKERLKLEGSRFQDTLEVSVLFKFWNESGENIQHHKR